MATITSVHLTPIFGSDKLKAYATIVIDDAWVIHGLKVLDDLGVLRVEMPTVKINGDYHKICHPRCREADAEVKHAVLGLYNEMMRQATTGAA